MRFLIDDNLSPRLVRLLEDAGHEARARADLRHAGRFGSGSHGSRIDEGRVLISADTDFGTLLAERQSAAPSVLLVRRIAERRVEELAGILLANLDALVDDLDAGAVVVFGEDVVRIRRLPIR